LHLHEHWCENLIRRTSVPVPEIQLSYLRCKGPMATDRTSLRYQASILNCTLEVKYSSLACCHLTLLFLVFIHFVMVRLKAKDITSQLT
jgi:hypothetical protein